MTLRPLAALALPLGLWAQEPAYFPEPAQAWWRPEGQFRLEAERLPSLTDPASGTEDRLRSLATLSWTRAWSHWTGSLAVRGSAGSDGNRFNPLRYDQSPSNGAWLHRASLEGQRTRDRTFVSLTLGLQENPLVAQASLWDADLSVLGAGFRAGVRREDLGLVEAGLRGIAGEVRTFPGAGVKVGAVQAVLRMEAGAAAWTVHAGRWQIRWRAGDHRFLPPRAKGAGPGTGPPGSGEAVTTRYDAAGARFALEGGLPLEFVVYGQRNADTSETGHEVQAWIGPRQRLWVPRLGLVLQRLGRTGAAAPVNGDEWWFTVDARGPRVLVTLALPRRWTVTASHMEQRPNGGGALAKRTSLGLAWRF
jgi:hypothetical protein